MHTILKRTPVFMAVIMVLTALLLGGCFRKHIESAPPVKRPAPQPTAVQEPAPAPEEAPAPVAEAPAEAAANTPDIVEETYVVDAPDNKALPQVEEVELGAAEAEPLAGEATTEAPMETPAETASAMEAAAEPAEGAAAEAAPVEEKAVEADVEQAGVVAEEGVISESAVMAEATAKSEPMAESEAMAEPEPETKTFINPEDEVVDVVEDHTPVAAGEMHYIQVGAFSKSANAETVQADLIDQGYDVTVTMSTKGLYLVRVGGYAEEAGAREALEELKKQFPTSYLVKWDPAAK